MAISDSGADASQSLSVKLHNSLKHPRARKIMYCNEIKEVIETVFEGQLLLRPGMRIEMVDCIHSLIDCFGFDYKRRTPKERKVLGKLHDEIVGLLYLKNIPVDEKNEVSIPLQKEIYYKTYTFIRSHIDKNTHPELFAIVEKTDIGFVIDTVLNLVMHLGKTGREVSMYYNLLEDAEYDEGNEEIERSDGLNDESKEYYELLKVYQEIVKTSCVTTTSREIINRILYTNAKQICIEYLYRSYL